MQYMVFTYNVKKYQPTHLHPLHTNRLNIIPLLMDDVEPIDRITVVSGGLIDTELVSYRQLKKMEHCNCLGQDNRERVP